MSELRESDLRIVDISVPAGLWVIMELASERGGYFVHLPVMVAFDDPSTESLEQWELVNEHRSVRWPALDRTISLDEALDHPNALVHSRLQLPSDRPLHGEDLVGCWKNLVSSGYEQYFADGTARRKFVMKTSGWDLGAGIEWELVSPRRLDLRWEQTVDGETVRQWEQFRVLHYDGQQVDGILSGINLTDPDISIIAPKQLKRWKPPKSWQES